MEVPKPGKPAGPSVLINGPLLEIAHAVPAPRVTTVFSRQGGYAHNVANVAQYPVSGFDGRSRRRSTGLWLRRTLAGRQSVQTSQEVTR